MKRFDISAYAKSTLKGYILNPNEGVWDKLSSDLDKHEQINGQRKIMVKAMLFVYLGAIICGLGVLISDNSSTSTTLNYADTHQVNSKKRSKNSLASDKASFQEKVQEVLKPWVFNFTTTTLVSNTKKETHPTQKQKIPKSDVVKTLVTEELNRPKLVISKKANMIYAASPNVQVTDSEIDALLIIARQNIQKKREFENKQGVLLPTEEVKSNTTFTDTDKNTDKKDVSFEDNNIFREIMKIKFAFAN
jgi:hypothetical protein